MKVVRGGALPAGLHGTCVRGITGSRIKGLRAALAYASLGTAKGRSRTLEFMLSSNPASDPGLQANILPLIAWSRAAREGWADAETMRACFFGGPDGPILRLAR
eukprot:3098995-Pyramimonas_sp.AAC.1